MIALGSAPSTRIASALTGKTSTVSLRLGSASAPSGGLGEIHHANHAGSKNAPTSEASTAITAIHIPGTDDRFNHRQFGPEADGRRNARQREHRQQHQERKPRRAGAGQTFEVVNVVEFDTMAGAARGCRTNLPVIA